jgi:hypothetical protein
MPEEKVRSWQVPRFESDAEERAGWVQEQVEEGEGWLQNQSCYKNLGRNLRIFDGIIDGGAKSTLVTNGLKYDIKKFIEAISEVREIGTYSSDATQFKSIASIINKVAKGLYLESAFPRAIRKTLQYATVMGRGYIWPKVRSKNFGFGEREFVFEPMGLLDVIPVQVPKSNDVQDAYLATLITYMPVAEAHGKFALFQGDLQPVSETSYKSRVQARRADYAERYKYGQGERNWGDLYCEVRYTFVRDLRINSTGYELPMGEPGTSWFYKVGGANQTESSPGLRSRSDRRTEDREFRHLRRELARRRGWQAERCFAIVAARRGDGRNDPLPVPRLPHEIARAAVGHSGSRESRSPEIQSLKRVDG